MLARENTLFDQAGCSLVIAPFKGENQTIVSAVSVIRTNELNCACITHGRLYRPGNLTDHQMTRKQNT